MTARMGATSEKAPVPFCSVSQSRSGVKKQRRDRTYANQADSHSARRPEEELASIIRTGDYFSALLGINTIEMHRSFRFRMQVYWIHRVLIGRALQIWS